MDRVMTRCHYQGWMKVLGRSALVFLGGFFTQGDLCFISSFHHVLCELQSICLSFAYNDQWI